MGSNFLFFGFSCLLFIYYLYSFILIAQALGLRKMPVLKYYMLILSAVFFLSESVDLFKLPWQPYIYIVSIAILLVIGTSALIKGIKIYHEKGSLKAIPDELYIFTFFLVAILFALF